MATLKSITFIFICYFILTSSVTSAQINHKNKITWEEFTSAYFDIAKTSLKNYLEDDSVKLQIEMENLIDFQSQMLKKNKEFYYSKEDKSIFIEAFKTRFSYFENDFYKMVAVKHATYLVKRINAIIDDPEITFENKK